MVLLVKVCRGMTKIEYKVRLDRSTLDSRLEDDLDEGLVIEIEKVGE